MAATSVAFPKRATSIFTCSAALRAAPIMVFEVAATLGGYAHVGKQEFHDFRIDGLGRDTCRGNANALLENLGGAARNAARRHAADVAPVTAHRRIGHELAFGEDRLEQQDVVEVRPAGIGIVVQEHVARPDIIAVTADDLVAEYGTAKMWIGLSSSDWARSRPSDVSRPQEKSWPS